VFDVTLQKIHKGPLTFCVREPMIALGGPSMATARAENPT